MSLNCQACIKPQNALFGDGREVSRKPLSVSSPEDRINQIVYPVVGATNPGKSVASCL